MDDRSHIDRNDRERTRLATLAERLTDDQLALPLGDGWTIAGLLAHLAFWDRFVLARWQRALHDGTPISSLDDALPDLINAAAADQWRVLPARDAARHAVAAAEALDRAIAALPPAVVDETRRRDLPRLLDRSQHRREHLDEIEFALRR